jgi:integrase
MQLTLPFDQLPTAPRDEGAARPVTTLVADQKPTPDVATEGSMPPACDGLDSPPKDAATGNLQEVLERLGGELGKPGEDMRSAIRMLARGIGRKPKDVPTDPPVLRLLIGETMPARLAITPKRWANIRSLVLGAMKHAGVEVAAGRDTGGPSAAWREWLKLVPSKSDRHGLSRLASFCSRSGVAVEMVTEKVFAQFSEALEAGTLAPNPLRFIRSAAKAWNRAVDTTPGWPSLHLSQPPDTRRYALPPATFGESFHGDRDAYLARGGSPDPFADDYSKPLRRDTITQRRRAINQLATAAVQGGCDPSTIRSLADLTDPTKAKAALQWLLTRAGHYTPDLASKAQLLHTIAVLWVKDEGHATKLAAYARAFHDPVKRRGMTAKNRERLRQFDLVANVQALLVLPLRILEQAKAAKEPTEDMARQLMFALAVEILLVAPIRIKNLAWLEVEKHLLEVRRGRQVTRHIVIPDFDTKTRVAYEMELPQTSRTILAVYLDRFRSLLAPEGSPYLFPGQGVGPRNRSAFGRSLSEFIHRQTGLGMNPHLFRHLAAKLHLRAYPQQIEVVRLILSHGSSETTEKFYADLKADHAFRSYDAMIAGLRTEAAGPAYVPTKRPRTRRQP